VMEPPCFSLYRAALVDFANSHPTKAKADEVLGQFRAIRDLGAHPPKEAAKKECVQPSAAVSAYSKKIMQKTWAFYQNSPVVTKFFLRECAAYIGKPIDPLGGLEDDLSTTDRVIAVLKNGDEVAHVPPSSDPDLKALTDFRSQYEERAQATQVMVQQATHLVRRYRRAVAMVVGAAHARGVAEQLRRQGLPFAVLELNALFNENDPSVLTMPETERRYAARPVTDTPIDRALAPSGTVWSSPSCSPTGQKHPQTAIQMPWLERKASLYELMHRFATQMLADGARIPPPEAFTTPYGYIDTTRLHIVGGGPAGGRRAIYFPLVIKQYPDGKKTIWVVLQKSHVLATPSGDASTDAERVLLADLSNTGNGGENGGGGRRGGGGSEEPPGPGEGPKSDDSSTGREFETEIQLGIDVGGRTFESEDKAAAYAVASTR